MSITLRFVLDSIDGKLLSGDPMTSLTGISTDSRRYAPGQLFFALEGASFDGHDYVDDLIRSDAAGVVISKPEKVTAKGSTAVILVEDVLQALQALAASYRKRFDIPVVAVTGSVGKTTTKDILAACLAPVYKTLKTPGNFNNEIGLPLTILGLDESHQAAVIELAMRAPGEIAHLASILQPTQVIITNVAPVHLETMGSLENIAAAKCEVLKSTVDGRSAFINGDDPYLLAAAQAYPGPQTTFGYSEECDVCIVKVEKAPPGLEICLSLWGQPHGFWFPLPAPRLVPNLAAAVGCAFLLGVSPALINQGLQNYRTAENRLNIVELPEGGAFINDTYNANPVSMAAALEVCREISQKRRAIAMLGDMLELGEYEMEGHLEVGRRVAQLDLDMLVTLGERAVDIARGALETGYPRHRVISFQQRGEALAWMRRNISRRDVVLFKGSRGMRLEEMLQGWLA